MTSVTTGHRTSIDLRSSVPSLGSEHGSQAPEVTVVVPARNEARNVGWVLAQLPPCVGEVILVDGRSSDDTVAVARKARPDVVVVEQTGVGKGAALRAGFAAARGELIVMLDADCSMHPLEVERFVQTLRGGYDFVKGSRYLPGGGSEDITRLRSAGNRVLTAGVNALFLVPFTDLCYGYIGFRRACLQQLALTGDGFEIETELVVKAVKAGLRIAEVPSMEANRRFGESNLRTFRDGGRVLRTMLRERLTPRARPVVDRLELAVETSAPTGRASLIDDAWTG